MQTTLDQRRPIRSVAIAAIFAVGLGSCGTSTAASTTTTNIASSVPTGGTAATIVATTTAAPLGTGPATAQLSLVGPAAAGGVAAKAISCVFPGFVGLSITVFGQTTDPNVQTFVVIDPSGVHVRIASGSSTNYSERDFIGTGVTNFDPARGVQLDSPLSETTGAKGTGATTLPVPTSIKGTVGCGGQRAGSSTIVLTGETADGKVDGTQNPVRVACFTGTTGAGVTVIGVVKVGTTTALVFVTSQPDTFTVSMSTQGGTSHLFKGAGPGTAATTAQGVHISGDAIEQVADGGTVHTLHVAGDATCGSTVGA